MKKQKTNKSKAVLEHYYRGTEAPWYNGWSLTDKEREVYSNRSKSSASLKKKALNGEGPSPIHDINMPLFKPEDVMKQIKKKGLTAISLYSGCGGLDIGFELAGFTHIASYEILEIGAEILTNNHPSINVYSGEKGDVRKVNWKKYRGKVNVIHGGPPCQPFSTAGKQLGKNDSRDMFPEFVRAVLEAEPLCFVAENVPSLGSKQFKDYVSSVILKPLEIIYDISIIRLNAYDFGVPQVRRRIFFVGTNKRYISKQFKQPQPTHSASRFLEDRADAALTLFADSSADNLERCMGVREALGLPSIGYDSLAPTLRSGLTGPRHTTSILSSTAALRKWDKLQIWPNGVARNREEARLFPPTNNHFRLSVEDCAVIQGFPSYWKFDCPVYMAIGVIGNSVAPPVAYNIAKALSRIL